MQQEVHDFIEFMHIKTARQASLSKYNPASLSGQILATDWNWPEEVETWVSY